MDIHPTAIIHPNAKLGNDVTVGPYSVIGEHVTIGRETRLFSHVNIDGWTEIGERCQVYPFASIGMSPQHLQYNGEPTRVVIGHDNIIREYVTVNRGTVQGGGATILGHGNFLMAYVHVAHDCHLGNHLVMANAATLAGHITIGDHAIIGGLVGIHQHVRVGAYAMIGGCSAVRLDVPPFLLAAGGHRAKLYGVNSIGLRRKGFARGRVLPLKRAYQLLFRSDHRLAEAIKIVRDEFIENAEVMNLVTFLETTRRGVCTSVRSASGNEEQPDG